MPKTTKLNLALIGPSPEPQGLPVPAGLGEIGGELWREVTAMYAFDDPASLEMLRQACFATQRAERCAASVNEHGEMIRVGKTLRANPLLRDELGFRALAARLLSKLGLDLEPVRVGPGRPPGVS
jgi:hypothetical protein